MGRVWAPPGAELRYRKADQILTVRIADVPYVGRVIEISRQV